MKQAHAPQCPDCTYLLEGLTVPRCPECGLEFDSRLLTDPWLARPRPAWERRPHVGLLRAAWRTLIDVTLHPRRFFSSIQQPSRLRRALSWSVCLTVGSFLVVLAYVLVVYRIEGSPRWRPTILETYTYILTEVAANVLAGWGLIVIPLVALLLTGDVLLWRDRARYRLFFKGVCYSMTVYVWLAASIWGLMLTCGLISSVFQPSWFPDRLNWPWTNWMFAGAITWQYALVFYGVLGPRFGALLSPWPGWRFLRVLVAAAWIGSVYLALWDVHLGLRYRTAAWS